MAQGLALVHASGAAMADQSPNLALPLLLPAQAQKHVTHNEALSLLDLLVQLRVASFDAVTPPAQPEDGEIHALGDGATGAWAGQDGLLAAWVGGGWLFVPPRDGWRAWDTAQGGLRVFDGGAWSPLQVPPASAVPELGINTGSDAINRLAVASPATLFSHEGAGHQLKINKALATDTASLLFQTGWSGRAEMGAAGTDDWSIKVSPDGSTWTEALRIDAATGRASGAAVQASSTDSTADRLMKVGAFGLGVTAGAPVPSDDFEAITRAGYYSGGSPELIANAPAGANNQFAVFASASNSNNVFLLGYFRGENQWMVKEKTAGTWGGWRPLYTSENILGTVSQSGGVPTGALIERGSNMNGEYVRFADGLQICLGEITLTQANQTACVATWLFPAAYSATPSGIFLALDENSLAAATPAPTEMGLLSSAGETATSATLRQYRANGNSNFAPGDTLVVRATAFGRWF
jgi:hypothetical protein